MLENGPRGFLSNVFVGFLRISRASAASIVVAFSGRIDSETIKLPLVGFLIRRYSRKHLVNGAGDRDSGTPYCPSCSRIGLSVPGHTKAGHGGISLDWPSVLQ